MRSKILAFAISLAALSAPLQAYAGAGTDTVKTQQTALFKLIAQPKSDARQAKLRQLFDRMLAYDAFAVGSMGDKWDTLTDAQKKEFSELLTELVRNNYRRNLEKMLDYEVSYVSEETKGELQVVKTKAKHKTKAREPAIDIVFHLKKIGGVYKVVDLFTENASLVMTYRSQFLRIIKKDGFAKLIAKMKKKLAKMDG